MSCAYGFILFYVLLHIYIRFITRIHRIKNHTKLIKLIEHFRNTSARLPVAFKLKTNNILFLEKPLTQSFSLSCRVFKCQYDLNRNLEIRQKNKAVGKTVVSHIMFFFFFFLYEHFYLFETLFNV